MSLLQKLEYREYQKALEFSLQKCEIIAKLAKINYKIEPITFSDSKKPGETLVKALDRYGLSTKHYLQLVTESDKIKTITTYYKPRSKVAILVANEKYTHMSKLVTPSVDCDSLASHLKNTGFIPIKIKNSTSRILRNILTKIVDVLEENSYCFFFYAGHGCQIGNIKCMLGVDCPAENITLDHCVTENFMLNEIARSKPEQAIVIMDMCRVHMDRDPHLDQGEFRSLKDYKIHKNLLLTYSTQSSQAAYEVLQIECSNTINTDDTYELKTGDTDRIIPGASQYVNALCSRFDEDLDISSMLDKVHGDLENSIREQRPLKMQWGVKKKSLYDPTTGDTEALLKNLREAIQEYNEYCTVF